MKQGKRKLLEKESDVVLLAWRIVVPSRLKLCAYEFCDAQTGQKIQLKVRGRERPEFRKTAPTPTRFRGELCGFPSQGHRHNDRKNGTRTAAEDRGGR